MADDDDNVDTTIVEIDTSPKDILIREYSGLLDELDGDFDEDEYDDDDDLGGFAAPAAAAGAAGGAPAKSGFASTVFAAQGLASKIIAAKNEYDESQKAEEEAAAAKKAAEVGKEGGGDGGEGDENEEDRLINAEQAALDKLDADLKAAEVAASARLNATLRAIEVAAQEELDADLKAMELAAGDDPDLDLLENNRAAAKLKAQEKLDSTLKAAELAAQENLDAELKAIDDAAQEELEALDVAAQDKLEAELKAMEDAAEAKLQADLKAMELAAQERAAQERAAQEEVKAAELAAQAKLDAELKAMELAAQEEMEAMERAAQAKLESDRKAEEIAAAERAAQEKHEADLKAMELAAQEELRAAEREAEAKLEEELEAMELAAQKELEAMELAAQEKLEEERKAAELAAAERAAQEKHEAELKAMELAAQEERRAAELAAEAKLEAELKAMELAAQEKIDAMELAAQEKLDEERKAAALAEAERAAQEKHEAELKAMELAAQEERRAAELAAEAKLEAELKAMELAAQKELEAMELAAQAKREEKRKAAELAAQGELDPGLAGADGDEVNEDLEGHRDAGLTAQSPSSQKAEEGGDIEIEEYVDGIADAEFDPDFDDGGGSEVSEDVEGGGKPKSGFAGTVFQAQSFASQLLAAKNEFDEKQKAEEEVREDLVAGSRDATSAEPAPRDETDLDPEVAEELQGGDLTGDSGQNGDIDAAKETGVGGLDEKLRETSNALDASRHAVVDELDLDPKVAGDTENGGFNAGLGESAKKTLSPATEGLAGQDEFDFDPKVAEEAEPSGDLGDSKTTSSNLGSSGPERRPGHGDAANQGRGSKKAPRSDAGARPKRPTGAGSPRKPAGGGKQASADAQANVPEDPPLAPEEVVWRQQILEWFQKHAFGQSIDCDFKLRHKMANGYLVGACLAHYNPGKLDSAEFNRGNNPTNKAANWDFVQKFMKRRGYGLLRQDIDVLSMVPMPAGGGVAAAHRVLLRLYAFLMADGLVPSLPGMPPPKLKDLPARPKISIYERQRNEDEFGDDGTGTSPRRRSPARPSPYGQAALSRRPQPPTGGDADAFPQSRRRRPEDPQDTSREHKRNGKARTAGPTGARATDAYPDIGKHGGVDYAGGDGGEGGVAKGAGGGGGRKGVKWNSGKGGRDNAARKAVCGECGRCNDCGRRRAAEREDGTREIYGERFPRAGDGHPHSGTARRGRYRGGRAGNDRDESRACDCDGHAQHGQHDPECACHTPYARRRYGARAAGSSTSPVNRRRNPNNPNAGRKLDGIGAKRGPRDGRAVSPLKVSSPRIATTPLLSPNAESPLTQMTGFGSGDGGWSGRVEERRQKKLLNRNRGAVRPAEVGDSGVIQPSAPAGPMPGSGQAISPTRLRRLVNVEPTKSEEGQPSRPKAIDRNLSMGDDNSRVSAGSVNEPATATPNTASTNDGRDKSQGGLSEDAPKRAGFDSYADEGSESGAAVHWG